MGNPMIKEIAVEGLHEQFDVQLQFMPGLNIIYGKNGRGKTTLLHILANALELDFRRFQYLSFRRITITTFNNATLEIVKPGANERPLVFVDGAATSLIGDSTMLSEAESAAIRSLFGERATYLPAFRSVLERVRSEYDPYYRTNKEADYDELVAREVTAIRSALDAKSGRETLEHRAIREEATVTAFKTLQCRQWFGQFVPIIRYPSILEVDDGLSTEWRAAQFEMAQREQNMFADVFVQVFRTIVGMDQPKPASETETLLASIAESLNDQEDKLGDRASEAIYGRLLEATDFLKNKSGPNAKTIENSVLQLYVDTLAARKNERKKAFQKSRDFEASINKFLDKKHLKIGPNNGPKYNGRARSSVTVGTDGGRAYGLSALSSGEKQILTMLYSASRSRFKSGIFLIDEPELSLHIDWQRQILREIMAQAPDRQIIACTHSPEVGAEHLEDTQDFEPVITRSNQEDLFDDVEDEE